MTSLNMMIQFISGPTYFTENSNSCLDLVIANNRKTVDFVHVGPSLFQGNIRYHCPTYGIIKICKPSQTCFKRRIWLYDRGDFNLFREKLAAVNWDDIFASVNNDLDRVVDLFTNILLKAAADSIPNKVITVRKMDPPWINNAVRRAIRKRNRLNNRAKKTNLPEHWAKFRKFRNKTVNLVRQQKQVYFDGLVNKLRSDTLGIRNWWITASKLAGFKSCNSDIPPLLVNDDFISNDIEKAEAFNIFVASQSNVNDNDKSVPEDDSAPVNCLDNILLQEQEVKDALQIVGPTT